MEGPFPISKLGMVVYFQEIFFLYTDRHYWCTRRKGTTVVGRENEVNNEKSFHISKIGENPNANC